MEAGDDPELAKRAAVRRDAVLLLSQLPPSLQETLKHYDRDGCARTCSDCSMTAPAS